MKEKMSSMSAFKIGDQIVAKVTAQGMQSGQTYTVTDIDQQSTAFGIFVSYKIKSQDGKEMWVQNLHLLASKAGKMKQAVGQKAAALLRRMRFGMGVYEPPKMNREKDRAAALQILSPSMHRLIEARVIIETASYQDEPKMRDRWKRAYDLLRDAVEAVHEAYNELRHIG